LHWGRGRLRHAAGEWRERNGSTRNVQNVTSRKFKAQRATWQCGLCLCA